MHLIRLAYSTQFLLAVIAIFVLWSEVGGQGHLDLIPWYWKFVLGVGAALAFVMATAAAVGRESAWNRRTLAWAGILLVLLVGCGLASYYVHLYDEETDEEDEDQNVAVMLAPSGLLLVFEAGDTVLVVLGDAGQAGDGIHHGRHAAFVVAV
jgi:hypothetical protein